MSGIQIVGNTNNTTAAEVELNTKAMRVVVRPNDYGSLGIYSVGAASGSMAAGLGANAPVYSFRWGNASNLAVVKKVLISAGGGPTTAFTAGIVTFQMLRALSFSASDTGGTSILPASNANKLRTSMATTLLTDLRISSTATLTAGTRTLDTNPIGSLTGSTTATLGDFLMLPTPLFMAGTGDYPLVCAQNEGFVIQATVPATGLWAFSVTTTWEELASY